MNSVRNTEHTFFQKDVTDNDRGYRDHFIKSSMSVHRIVKPEEFNDLKEVWNSLAEKSKLYIPWKTWEWFDLWMNHYAGNEEKLILTVYLESDLVGVAPFVVKEERYRNVVTARVIRFAGDWNSAVKGIVLNDNDEILQKKVVRTVLDYMKKEYVEWDVMELDSIPEEQSIYKSYISCLEEDNISYRTYFSYKTWHADEIDYSGNEYVRKRTKKRRDEYKRRKRKLKELGSLEYRVATSKAERKMYLDTFDSIRNRSWKGILSDKEFICDFRGVAGDKGWMRVGLLMLNGSPVSGNVALVCNKGGYLLSSAYDNHYKAMGAGMVSRVEMIKHLIDVEKVISIDTIKGNEGYKKYWYPKCKNRMGINIFNSTFKGKVLSTMETVLLPVVNRSGFMRKVKRTIKRSPQ